MIYIQEAIKKAVKSGYKLPGKVYVWDTIDAEEFRKQFWTDAQGYFYSKPAIFTDPLFWSSLGKALGWGPEVITRGVEDVQTNYWRYRWQQEFHNFIDHLIEAKDVNEFFKELLK